MNKPAIPQGMRDFGPDTVRKRNYIFNTIRKVFEVYGFQPLEPPAMELLETLMGKYGEEGDKLMFKVLNNGLSDPKNTSKARTAFDHVLSGRSDKDLTERALKYDLTIPFARYVAMNAGQLTFPFKRYQIQPVWRADRPQKGRYREFYQCDADVVGSRSLLNELELALIYTTVFKKLNLQGIRILVNNRKVLKGIIETCQLQEWEKRVLITIDKTDKIGVDGVKNELLQEGIPSDRVDKLVEIYSFKADNNSVLDYLKQLFSQSATGISGVEELQTLVTNYTAQGGDAIQIDLTLARGLDYYTGVIFEVRAPQEVKIGSIGGGGRYDDLTGLFGVADIPGVGISFGVDRIYDVLEELKLFPEAVQSGTKILFCQNLFASESELLHLMQQLRNVDIACELYPDNVKLDKQFKYAERKQIPFAVIAGENEWKEGKVVLRDLVKREQTDIDKTEIVERISDILQK